MKGLVIPQFIKEELSMLKPVVALQYDNPAV